MLVQQLQELHAIAGTPPTDITAGGSSAEFKTSREGIFGVRTIKEAELANLRIFIHRQEAETEDVELHQEHKQLVAKKDYAARSAARDIARRSFTQGPEAPAHRTFAHHKQREEQKAATKGPMKLPPTKKTLQ